MRKIKNYTPSVPVVMRILKDGKLTIQEAADILQCSVNSVQSLKKDFGIETMFVGTASNRKAASEANKARNDLLETLAKRIKYEDADVQELSKEFKIPSRTLYRWALKV